MSVLNRKKKQNKIVLSILSPALVFSLRCILLGTEVALDVIKFVYSLAYAQCLLNC